METRTRATRMAQAAPAPKVQPKATNSTSGHAKDAFERSTVTIRSPPQPYARPGTPMEVELSTPPKLNDKADPFNSGTPRAPGHKATVESPLKIKPPPNAASAPMNPTQAMLKALTRLQEIYEDTTKAKKETVTMDLNTFITVGNLLNAAYEQNTKPKEQDKQTITTIQEDIAEIKATVKDLANNTTRTTWAQVAAAQPRPKPELPPECQTARSQRAKCEVTLSTRGLEDGEKEKLTKMSDQELTSHLKQFTNMDSNSDSDLIIAARKTTKQTIKIRCETDINADKLRNVPWNSYITGLSVVKPTYSVVVHGASKLDVNLENESTTEYAKKEIETTNLKRFTINKITPLRKRQRNPSAPTQSIVIQLSSLEEANECIRDGIFIGQRLHQVEKYMPQYQLKQCFKCYRYGHTAAECTRKATCGKCGHDHLTSECQATKLECTHCKGEQPAWHNDCPARKQEMTRLETLKMQHIQQSLYFSP